jgi:hypothetical protein
MRLTIDKTTGALGNRDEASLFSRLAGPVKRVSLALLAGVGMAAVAPVAEAYNPPPADLFPVGVFLQPTTTFDTWKSRGVNTVVDFWPDPSQSLDQWNKAAVDRGLYMIRAARPDPKQDINEKYLLAWSQPDEPDWKNIPQSQLAATYATLKAADPKRPVYINFAGSMALNPWIAKDGSTYKAMSQTADIVANDIYPVTAWNRPAWIDFSKALDPKDPYNTTGKRLNPGTAIDILRNFSGGKRQMAYIETSFQHLDSATAANRGVTPGELRGEVWDAIIHGAKGITYFPQQVGGGVVKVDNTTPEVVAEITKQDAVIKSLAAVINTGNDATSNSFLLSNPDLEGTWREFNGQKYLFVLNMSTATLTGQSFSTPGLAGLGTLQVVNELRSESVVSGTINDSFQPYELHVYSTTAPNVGGLPGAPVPEPTGSAILLAGVASCLLKRRRRGTDGE